MQYTTVPFDPPVKREGPTSSAASALDTMISTYAANGWEFVGVQNHSTIVPGSAGCFGIGATSPYPQTVSLVVFRK